MKLLICDDDISTVDVIQNQIDWNALGITRILRAYNGTVAKEIILKENPELVLCDVEMPQCNGIEVLKYVSENGIHTNFAFLTCYESFEYAREAVRYGAPDDGRRADRRLFCAGRTLCRCGRCQDYL